MTRSGWASGWLRRTLSRTEVMELPLRTVAAGSCASAAGRWEGPGQPELGQRQACPPSPRVKASEVLVPTEWVPVSACGVGVKAAWVGACAAGAES